MGLLTQQDPIGIAGGLNLYGYAGGDPVNFSDPFGLKCEGDAGNSRDLTSADPESQGGGGGGKDCGSGLVDAARGVLSNPIALAVGLYMQYTDRLRPDEIGGSASWNTGTVTGSTQESTLEATLPNYGASLDVGWSLRSDLGQSVGSISFGLGRHVGGSIEFGGPPGREEPIGWKLHVGVGIGLPVSGSTVLLRTH